MRYVRWVLLGWMLFGLMVGIAVIAWWIFGTTHTPQEGIYIAGSIRDEQALGGFGKSDNFPKDLAGQEWGQAGKVSLLAFPEESLTYLSRTGVAVRLVNRTDATVPFGACDSCLFLVQEAVDREGKWRPIELMPDSLCGNSFHRVFLDQNQYWEFPALRYSGISRTRLRFRLEQGQWRTSDTTIEGFPKPTRVSTGRGGHVFYSNEFEGRINVSQFVTEKLETAIPE